MSLAQEKIKVVAIAPFYDKNGVSESLSTYNWLKGLEKKVSLTVLTTHIEDWEESQSPLPQSTVVNWTYSKNYNKLNKFNSLVKPAYFPFYKNCKKWLSSRISQNDRFDIIHQINPIALRYPSPALHFNIPYIIGPLAGSLETPKGLAKESPEGAWYRKFRNLDPVRLKYDPWLRKTFERASLVLGAAPYVEKVLSDISIKKFAVESETGIFSLTEKPKKAASSEKTIKLLFAGRLIQTKGILYAIKAAALASKKCKLVLNILGAGDLSEDCKNLISSLNAQDYIKMHGRIPREDVYEFYRNSDIFLFPSYREPSGNVIFEAMSQGLPIITSNRGGPAHVVDENCGILVDPSSPENYTSGLARAIETLAANQSLRDSMSNNAVDRMKELALWDSKIDRIVASYKSILEQRIRLI